MIDPKRPAAKGVPERQAAGENLDFQRGLAGERKLQKAIKRLRADFDGEIARSGAAPRVRERSLARVRQLPFAGIDWHKIAAAMLVAGVLGGVLDLILPSQETESADVVMVDPVLYGLDVDLQ